MNIHEYQAKEILKKFGINILNGVVVFSLEEILKYNPFKKYLVSSFDIANLVLFIKFKIAWDLTVIFLELFELVSIRGNSSFGRQDKENFETFDLIVNIFLLIIYNVYRTYS